MAFSYRNLGVWDPIPARGRSGMPTRRNALSVALEVGAVRASRAPAQLRRRREGVARSERVHRVRGWCLRLGNHCVRRHDVGNTPIPPNRLKRHRLQSSVQDCSRAQKVVFVRDLTLCGTSGTGFWSLVCQVRRQGTLVSRSRFSHHHVTDDWSILRSRKVRRVAHS